MIALGIDTLRAQSILIGTEGPDIGWYVCPLPDGRWMAWDDADPADPGHAEFDTQADAVAFQHSGYREAYPEIFGGVTWIPLKEAALRLHLTPRAVLTRIHRGQWPLGHADLRAMPMQPRPAWFVTVKSLE